MSKLNEIAYAMTIEVEWADDDWELQNTEFHDDYDNFRFSITIPGANENSESPRVLRRLFSLRGLSHEQEVEPVFT